MPKLSDKQDSTEVQPVLPLDQVAVNPIAPHIFVRLSPAKPTLVYESYWRLAAERQEIFFRRFEGRPAPWTQNSVLLQHKFTNAYRASDRVSQFLIKEVIYEGEQTAIEIFFRTLLFKFFNRIETWTLLCNELEKITWKDYSFDRYNQILTEAMLKGERIYSAAYIMPSGGRSSPGGRKHHMHLRLLEKMMADNMPQRIATASSTSQIFELLLSYPTIGEFLAYQYATDLNYSPLTPFEEKDFVIPGPGARDGIRKCFYDLGGLSESEIIKFVADRQQRDFESLNLSFRSLWGRPLQLIDCQNLFCEVDKYARVKHPEVTGLTGRTRIKQKYRSSSEPLSYWYPPKWKLNHLIDLHRTKLLAERNPDV